MARKCTVCEHAERDKIDQLLVEGVSFRKIAERSGTTITSLHRHKQAHLSPALASVHNKREEERAETLLDRVETLYTRASSILAAAETQGRPSVSLSAIRELRGIVELLGKLTGELDDRPQQVVNVLVSSEWHQVRAAIFDALDAHPEAREAIAGRLLELEAG